VQLPSRRTINVFFYDGPISQGVAFERLLDDGKRFADRLVSGFSDTRQWPQLVNIATDGESYGHHHRFGEMALSYALHYIEENKLAQITNYAEFLERHPPDHFVEIVDNSSWSCVHGVERWRANCGCNSGGRAGWSQMWRGPLRESLDWLRDRLIPLYEEKGRVLLKDPWHARDEYIGVILDRSPQRVDQLLAEHATHPLSHDEQVTALKLLEIQRQAMLMYTSCGWFFDEVSGLETVQVLQYAGRAVRLAQDVFNNGIESEFLDRLAAVKSNLVEHGDARQIYEKWVKPAFVSIEALAGHYAISSVFEAYGERTKIYCYDVEREDYTLEAEGKHRLGVGRGLFSSSITREADCLAFGVLHLGDHNISAGVTHFDNIEAYKKLKASLIESFAQADTAGALRNLAEAFSNNTLSLRTLFRDEQRKIVSAILNDSLANVEAAYGTIYENQAPLVRFLHSLGIPIPAAFQSAVEVALNSRIKKAFDSEDLDTDTIQSYLKEAALANVKLDAPGLEYAIQKRLEKDANEFAARPTHLDVVQKLRRLLDFVSTLPFPVRLWDVQNISFTPLIRAMAELAQEAGSANGPAKETLNELALVRERLRINNR
jgi:hypothetical protein